jgi:hypothetical protein
VQHISRRGVFGLVSYMYQSIKMLLLECVENRHLYGGGVGLNLMSLTMNGCFLVELERRGAYQETERVWFS